MQRWKLIRNNIKTHNKLINSIKHVMADYGGYCGRGSYPRRGRPGEDTEQGHHSGRDGRNYGFSEGNYENRDSGHSRGRGRGRGRGGGHPAHLTGKAIGLYYRDKSIKKKNKELKKAEESQGLKLDPLVRETVERMLMKTKPPYAPRLGNNEAFDNDNDDDSIGARYTHIGDSQFKRKFIEIVSGNIQQNLSKALLAASKLEKNERLDEKLFDEHRDRQDSNNYRNMMNFRSKLPSYNMRGAILDLVNENQVVVISGETGCGKTTQVAQFILDDAIERGNGSVTKVVCTQPRRISAVSVAERVAAERAEPLGKSVGYQIRLEKIPTRDHGSILFCTTGLLLQYMQSDPALRDFSHVILDEIHERNTESDFIVTLLKQIIPKRPDLKVILMSATLNSDRFSSYYNNCPNIHIPGFTYPVSDYFLEDVLEVTRFRFPMQEQKTQKKARNLQGQVNEFDNFIRPAVRLLEMEKKYSRHVTDELKNPMSEKLSLELIQALLEYICTRKSPGAILIFLPGMMDITKLTQLLLESGQFPPHRCVIYPLHSRMPTVEQKLIFKPPPEGMRKIIIATSIAETSITIEDVVYVIDCGRTKLTRFDILKNIETLEPEWISLANAKQRRGRAGRVQPGECYHLYTKAREHTFEEYPSPEMLRTPLEQVILQAKILQLGKVEIFLSSVMDPPEPRAIELSLDLLRTLNALDNNEHLTPLGYHLAKLPLDPRTGKMIIWASLFSCVDPVFSIAASLTFKDAFYCPFGKEDEANRKKLELGLGHHSDHIALAEALKRFESSFANGQARRFCYEHFLSWNTLKLLSDMKRQFARHLCEMKFLDCEDPRDRFANRNSNNLAMIKAIVCAGLYPNVATIVNKDRGKGHPKIRTGTDGTVKIHPGSINARASSLPTQYLTYFLKQRSTAIYLHDTTSVSWVALLFAAPKCTIETRERYCNIVLSNLLSIRCETQTAGLIQRLRQDMETLLEYKITHPGTVKWDSPEGQLLRAIAEIVSQGYPEMENGMYRSPPNFEDVYYSSD